MGFPDSSVGKETTCNADDPRSIPGEGKIHWRRDRLPAPVFLSFLCGSAGKESAYNARDLGSIPGLGRSPGEGKGYPLQYSGLENSKDRIVHGGPKSWTQLSDFHFHFHSPQRGFPNLPANAGDIEVSNFYALGLGFKPSVRKIPWRRAWQPTLVFLPGESHGQRSLAGCSL